MEITDFDVKDGFKSTFRYGVKCCTYFYHIAFLETCKDSGVYPSGLKLDRIPFISFVSNELIATWETTLKVTQDQLLETLLCGIFEKLTWFENMFFDGLLKVLESTETDEFKEWLVKLLVHLEKLEKRICKRKKQKLKKLVNQEHQNSAIERFIDHEKQFEFKNELYKYATRIDEDIPNLVTLTLLGSSFFKKSNEDDSTASGNDFILEDLTLNNSEVTNDSESTACEKINERYVGKFVSSNVVNLSKRVLSSDEISLLSKGLKFIPTPTSVNRAFLKEELEKFGRKLRLKWHFRNDESSGIYNKFRKTNSDFNPKGKDASIEIYLSRLEEEILNLDYELKFNNLTRAEREALKTLRDDTSIVIKEADKGSAVVVWDREDYLIEADRQLGDSNVYAELEGDLLVHLSRLFSIICQKLDLEEMLVRKHWSTFSMISLE